MVGPAPAGQGFAGLTKKPTRSGGRTAVSSSPDPSPSNSFVIQRAHPPWPPPFPAEHWAHIRSTNPIESLSATVRHRQRQTKGYGSRAATLAMAFKLSVEAEKKWRRLRGDAHLAKVVAGVRCIDGIEEGMPNPLENVA